MSICEYIVFDDSTMNNIPLNIHTIIFSLAIEIKKGFLPIRLHTLRFGYYFNKEIKEGVLPLNLHTLIFGNYFDQEIKKGVLPLNLHTLVFGWEFNQEIKEGVLPNNLHTLIFGNNFNKEIKEGVLPFNLHTLQFGTRFNQEIKEGVLPLNLHTLRFGIRFNKKVSLVKSIKEITLNSYNNIINNLGENIKIVKILFKDYYNENKKIINLPYTLEKIILEDEKYKEYIEKIPFDCIIEIQKIE